MPCIHNKSPIFVLWLTETMTFYMLRALRCLLNGPHVSCSLFCCADPIDVASSGQPSEAGTSDLPAATPANPAAQQGSSNGTVSAAAPPTESTNAGVAAGEKGAAGARSEEQQGAAMKEGVAGGRKKQQQGELEDGGQSEAHQGQEVSGEGEGTLLQPWSDHRGRLNEPFLRSITQRAVSIVIRHPGERTPESPNTAL